MTRKQQLIYCSIIVNILKNQNNLISRKQLCLQCSETVDWASGTASGLQKLSDKEIM